MSEAWCGLKVGQDVPDFKLEIYMPSSASFGEISLATLKKDNKWTILFFYPADFTFVWATEFADLSGQYENIKRSNAELITVSTDTKFVHLAWQKEEKLLENVTYPMGADPAGRLSRLFGVYDEETGLALRGTFIINPEGKLLASEVNYYNVGRNSDELIRKLRANVYLSGRSEEVCPAKWVEGSKTLKPSEEMVGKVYEALK